MPVFLYFLNGLHHGLGTDHLLAVTALARRGRGVRDFVSLGFRFGAGHTGLLMTLAILALCSGMAVLDQWQVWAEQGAGGLLICLGLWSLADWLRKNERLHSHYHSHPDGTIHRHLHFHLRTQTTPRHAHPHFPALLGGLFATSGVRSLLLGIVPLVQAQSRLWAFLCILLFGMGVMVAMTLYGWLAGSALRRIEAQGRVNLLLGVSTLAVGIYWIWWD